MVNHLSMNVAQTGQSFVVNQFREFYLEVVSLKSLIESGGWEQGSPDSNGGAYEGTGPEHNPVWARVMEKIQELARKAGHNGSPCTAESYREAQYVMAAMADETFLHLEWPGKDWWRAHLVETRLFQSHVAGERIFHRITHFLDNREAVCVELATLYLLMLSLGFQGKFRGGLDQESIERYRKELFRMVFHRYPKFLEGTDPMFAEAYAHTVEHGTIKNLPDPQKWVLGLCACVAAYVIVAHIMWRHLTGDLSDVVNAILALG